MLPLSHVAAEGLARRILENGVTATARVSASADELDSVVQRLEKVCRSLEVCVDALSRCNSNGNPKVARNGSGEILPSSGGNKPGSDVDAWLGSVSLALHQANDQVSEVSEMAFTSG